MILVWADAENDRAKIKKIAKDLFIIGFPGVRRLVGALSKDAMLFSIPFVV